MKRMTYISASRTVSTSAALLLILSVACGCAGATEPVDIGGDIDASMAASDAAIDSALSHLRQQLQAERPSEDPPSCDEAERSNCEQIDEVLASSPALRSVFVADEQLTGAGVIAAEEILHVRSHALDPRDFFVDDIRSYIDDLAAWQHGRRFVEATKMDADEALWLQRVALALDPKRPPSRARLVDVASGPDEDSIFPRQQRELRRYVSELRRVQDVASETNRLLLRAIVKYARVQKLNYNYTVSEQVLIDRQLLFADPEDPQEEEVLGGPSRSREWLEPWRMAGIDGTEPIDAEVVRRRENELVQDRVRQFIEGLPDGDFATAVASLPPDHEQYRKLRQAFERYLQYVEAGGWDSEPTRRTLERGDDHDDVVRLRQRLFAEGFLAEATESSEFDAGLEEALLEFQESSQVPETGETDSATRDAFEIDPAERLARLALTMQKWREIRSRRDFNAYHIQINIPSYYGEVREGGDVVYRYRVIVGRNSSEWSDTNTETPEFSDRLERMVFNPFWHLPTSIVQNEIIPSLAEEDDYIERHNYEVRKNGSRIFIKQLPGPGNALGQVKFLFPNQFAIYMHDTPTRRLFSRVNRAFSHGCMRVHEPLDLARFLIRHDRGWQDHQVDRFVTDALRRHDEDTAFHLDTPVPVHIVYLLSRVDEHGHVEFFEDVYGRQTDALDASRRQIAAWLDVEI